MSRVGPRQAVAKASRLLLRRPDPREILWVNFAVTYLCNSRCRVCRIWERYRRETSLVGEELSLAEIEQLLSSECLQNLEVINIIGGEPFLRRDIVDLAGLFIQRYPDALIGIASNGFSPGLIVRRTREIMEKYHPKLFTLSISLDGIGVNHDRMRGVKGAYERALQTLESLRAQTDINLGIGFTVTRWNYQDLWGVYELSKELGARFIAVFAHSSDSYYGNREVALDWDDTLSEAAHMVEKIAADRAAHESLLDKLVDPYAYFMAKGAEYELKRSPVVKCYSGVHSLFLDPYGDVFPCIMVDEKLGNARVEPFDQLWLSPLAAQVRNHIERQRCQCWVGCETVPSLLRGLNVPKWNLTNKILRPMVSRLNQRS